VAFDPNGEWGLRHRLRIALKTYLTHELLAEFLDVDPYYISRFLDEPDYIPPDDVVATIVANIGNVIPDEPTVTKTSIGATRIIHYVEFVVCDEEFFATFTLPDGVYQWKWHYHASYAEGKIRSSVLYDAASWSLRDSAEDAVGAALESITTLVIYAHEA